MPTRSQVGELIRDDYRVLSRHNGYLGVVYVCVRDSDEEPSRLAMKTFRFNEEICRQLFERELDNWVRLPRHPNLVHAIEADRDANLLLLEFVHGPSLREVAERAPVHPRFFAKWAREVADGLRFLHEENAFLHRDVRPANVLVDIEQELRAKISDLGLGKPFDPESANHTTIGTFNYMAPEVFDGKTDFRSDIFGFGATLYFLLTGHVAVQRSTKDAGPVAPARELIAEIPREVDDLVARCLARDPDDRPASMTEVLEALVALPDWNPTSVRYELCQTHSFLYPVESNRPACPFCVYLEEFRRSEKRMERAAKR